jgi:PI-3-kinase-related kinase SMG-1
VAVQQPSPDVLAVARRQAAELLARARGDHDDSVRQNYEVLRAHVERLVQRVHKLQEDHSELEASIDPEAEHKAKDRLLAIFTSYMQPLQEKSETTGRTYQHRF